MDEETEDYVDYNITPNRMTKCSPYELVYGHSARMLIENAIGMDSININKTHEEITDDANENQELYAHQMRKQRNKKAIIKNYKK